MTNPTTVKRTSDREMVVTRTFDAPPDVVFEAWTTPDLLKQWWVPKSVPFSLMTCEVDARTGGHYRFGFGDGRTETMAFFGRYVEVTPPSRLVWTNEESEEGSITTVTLEAREGGTLLTLHELYPSKAALDAALEGMEGGMPEQFVQLDALIAARG